jgi:nucleoid-associated protein YgaU
LEAFEVEPSYDREDPFGQAPRVLWGRVAALAGVVIFFFLLGTRFGGGGGASSQTVARLQQQINADNSKISSLQAQLSAAGGPASSPAATGSQASPAPSGASTVPSPAASGASGTFPITYTVKSGDTLTLIEERFYRNADPALTSLLESANGLNSSALHTGQQLTIPSPTQATTAPSPLPSPSPTK